MFGFKYIFWREGDGGMQHTTFIKNSWLKLSLKVMGNAIGCKCEELHWRPKEAYLMERIVGKLRVRGESKSLFPLGKHKQGNNEASWGTAFEGYGRLIQVQSKQSLPGLPERTGRDTQSPSHHPRSRYSRLHRPLPSHVGCQPPCPTASPDAYSDTHPLSGRLRTGGTRKVVWEGVRVSAKAVGPQAQALGQA